MACFKTNPLRYIKHTPIFLQHLIDDIDLYLYDHRSLRFYENKCILLNTIVLITETQINFLVISLVFPPLLPFKVILFSPLFAIYILHCVMFVAHRVWTQF